MLRVVSGLLFSPTEPPKVLMGLRKPTGFRPDLWELPGGKVERNEQPEVALAREWKEELGADIVVGDFITSALVEAEIDFVVDLYNVDCTNLSEIKNLDHVKLDWVEPRYAVTSLPCSPAFYRHYRHIDNLIKAIGREILFGG